MAVSSAAPARLTRSVVDMVIFAFWEHKWVSTTLNVGEEFGIHTRREGEAICEAARVPISSRAQATTPVITIWNESEKRVDGVGEVVSSKGWALMVHMSFISPH
jgi:hypothetical protein